MLARLYASSRDKLEADFQQFYGLDLELMGEAYSVRHAAVLAANLPSDSRCMREISADLEWSPEMHMLSLVEHDLRALIWTVSVVNSSKTAKPPFPKRIDPPSKQRQMVERLESTDIDEINELLGIRG